MLYYVNPTNGNDNAAGTQAAPFKTITRALQQAKANDTIQLLPGTYSAASGEVFPLSVPSGITVIGNEATKGSGILVTGSGKFPSPTFANQEVTFQLRTNAQLRGVTVTNPAVRGTGVWVESANPIIANNTFINNKREGVFATGNASPVVVNNVAKQNSASGFTIVRNSKGEWRGNVCDQTGFGIAISDDAAPLISENRVTQNRIGLVLNRSCRPVLRNNVVEVNKEEGISVTQQALPDLGQTQDPGGNILRSNGEIDLANDTPVTLISVGNQINPRRVRGPVEFLANEMPPPPPNPTPEPTPQPPPTPEPPPPTPNPEAGFSDTRGHWAEGFIKGLVDKKVISGFPDNTFKPQDALTRAQFAAMIANAFELPNRQPIANFPDVPDNFWAATAIRKANQMGFISGFPDGTFRPNQFLTRVQALVALVSGLGLTGGTSDHLLIYSDRAQIPPYASERVATATQKRMVVNYPDVRKLDPMREITRAEVSALVYQALVELNKAAAITSPYIVAPELPIYLFTDIAGHWAAGFIQALATMNLVSGFEDGTFRPELTMNRAQYATIIANAYNPPPKRDPIRFPDVPDSFWAKPYIEKAYRGGYISGFPDGTFQPNQNVLRLQILLSLASGLGLPAADVSVLRVYDDRASIVAAAQPAVAATTQQQIVVSYPNVKLLNPNRDASRAEVAAMVYQGLVQAGKAGAIASPYIVKPG